MSDNLLSQNQRFTIIPYGAERYLNNLPQTYKFSEQFNTTCCPAILLLSQKHVVFHGQFIRSFVHCKEGSEALWEIPSRHIAANISTLSLGLIEETEPDDHLIKPDWKRNTCVDDQAG